MRSRVKQKAIYFAIDQTLVRRHHTLKLAAAFLNVFFLIIVLAISVISNSNQKALAASYTWDGGGTTNNWSDCDNWSTNICPVAADSVTFNGTSTKDSTVDGGFGGTITGLTIASGYTGTITQARDLALSGTFNQATGTYSAGSFTLDINGAFTLSGGSFTASSGVMTLAGSMTISGSAVFNHNSGTLTLNGTSTSTVTCNNVIFNLVSISKTNGSLTVNSDCSLPLGDNPTIISSTSDGTVVNGTLTGTGTLGQVGGTLQFNSTSSLTGFSGLSATANLTINGITRDFTSFSPFVVTGTYSQTGGTITVPNGADFNGAFVLNSGSVFNAPAGTMSVASTFTLNSGSTFNANNGTVIFDGSTATLNCNNTIFSLIQFQNTGPKTVSANCSLPLGLDPTIPGAITLNGTLNGSGTLTSTAVAALTFQNAAAFSGFSGLVMSNSLVITGGANLNLSAYSLVDLNGIAVLGAATLTAPSGTMTVAGTFSLGSGTSTFNHSGGMLVFDGTSSAVISCNNTVFSLLVFAHTAGTKTVSSDCNLPLGVNPTIGSNAGVGLIVNGTLSGTGTLAIGTTGTTAVLIFNSTALLSGFTGLNVRGAMTVTGATANFSTYTDGLVVVGDFTANTGTNFTAASVSDFNGTITVNSGAIFTASVGEVSVAGNFAIAGGTFAHNNGTVLLDGTDQTLSGNTTFYNLTMASAMPAILTFTAGSTQTIEGDLIFEGADADNILSLVSSTPGTQWSIDAQGARTLQYLSVQDSNNINTNTMLAYDSEDLGNNINWSFLATPLPPNPTEPGTDPNADLRTELAETGESNILYILSALMLILIGSITFVLKLKQGRA